MPCFDYEPRPGELVLPSGGIGAPWHLVSNPSISVIAHAGGWIDLYSASTGLVRLTGGSRPRRQWGLTTSNGKAVEFETASTRFGMSYVEWVARADQFEVRRRVWTMPDGPPAVRIDTEVISKLDWQFAEELPLDPYPLIVGGLMSHRTMPSSKASTIERLQWDATLTLTSLSRAFTDLYRSAASKLLKFSYEDHGSGVAATPNRSPGSDGPSLIDIGVPIVFLAPADGSPLRSEQSPRSLRILAMEHGSASLSAIAGFATSIDELPDLVEEMSSATSESRADANRRAWRIQFEGSADTALTHALERESAWHASILRSLETYDSYFEARYPAQASAYGFIHGLQGAPRDYAISAIPLAMVDPPGARQAIEVMLRMTRPSGAMHYAHTGRGQVLSGGIHSYPSDLPIFLLWAVTEYVWATGDRDFLECEVPFYPKERETASTVRERLSLAFGYLRDNLGCGEHGMLRVGSGDWSDPITAMAPDRRAFRERGESGFNTAFAAYVLPRAAHLVEGRTAEEMRVFAGDLESAMELAWSGRWFYRGYDGLGAPLGRDHLFLDGQVFCLIADIGGRRAQLASIIKELLMDPSVVGPTILDKPHPVRFGILPPGWDCNGGVWAAINGLTAWGLSLADAPLGWECLSKQMLRAHARAYPHIWYGIWSGPDCYNSWMGDREGETFVQPATPMAEFPQPNSNAHAAPLLGLMRVLGIEAGPDGLAVATRPGAERLPFDSWRLLCSLTNLESHEKARGKTETKDGMRL